MVAEYRDLQVSTDQILDTISCYSTQISQLTRKYMPHVVSEITGFPQRLKNLENENWLTEKSWNMESEQNVKDFFLSVMEFYQFCDQSWKLTTFGPQFYQICAFFFVESKKFSTCEKVYIFNSFPTNVVNTCTTVGSSCTYSKSKSCNLNDILHLLSFSTGPLTGCSIQLYFTPPLCSAYTS